MSRVEAARGVCDREARVVVLVLLASAAPRVGAGTSPFIPRIPRQQLSSCAFVVGRESRCRRLSAPAADAIPGGERCGELSCCIPSSLTVVVRDTKVLTQVVSFCC